MLKIYETQTFEKEIKRLQKKYRNISEDIEIFKTVVSVNKDICGDKIPGFGGGARKFRVASRDMGRGKSGGFRIIGYLIDDDECLFLLTVYAKSEKENISNNELTALIKQALDEL